jgi:hypothetical protein
MSTQTTVSVIFEGATLEVTGDYYPAEPMVKYYPDGSGYPGSFAEFDIIDIFICDEDVYDLIDRIPGAMEEIRDKALEEVGND